MAKVVIPANGDELEDMLSDSAKLKEVFSNSASTKEFMNAYAKAFVSKDTSAEKQIDEQVQATMAKFMKENAVSDAPPVSLRNGRPNIGNGVSNGRGAVYNRNAPGARLDEQKEDLRFNSTADYFQAVWHHSNTLSNSEQLSAKMSALRKVQNSFGSEVPADGGFLIPETLRSNILQWALESSIVRPRAQVIPMDSLRVPIPMIDSTSNVSSVFGGVVCYWTEEGAALTESQAAFGRVVLDAKKLTGYANIPNELLADAVAFSSFFDQVFPKALAFYEDYAFMAGSGSGEPQGFINSPAVASVAKEVGQTASTIVYENIVKMYSRMLPTSLGNAVWIASIDSFPQLATMALSVGTGGSAVWVGNGNPTNAAAGSPPMSILGRPVLFTEKASVLGTTGDINFVDLSYYLIGDRQTMQTSSSPHYKFANDETSFRIVERVDGRPWLQSPITPKNNSSSTLSPFVQVATRS